PGERFRAFGQYAAVGDITGALERKDEILWHLIVPFLEAFGLLAAIKGAVDFDRTHLFAHILKLALLGEAIGVKDATPGLEGPTTNTDMDFACHCCVSRLRPSLTRNS